MLARALGVKTAAKLSARDVRVYCIQPMINYETFLYARNFCSRSTDKGAMSNKRNDRVSCILHFKIAQMFIKSFCIASKRWAVIIIHSQTTPYPGAFKFPKPPFPGRRVRIFKLSFLLIILFNYKLSFLRILSLTHKNNFIAQFQFSWSLKCWIQFNTKYRDDSAAHFVRGRANSVGQKMQTSEGSAKSEHV